MDQQIAYGFCLLVFTYYTDWSHYSTAVVMHVYAHRRGFCAQLVEKIRSIVFLEQRV